MKTINVPAKKADYYKQRLPEELHGLIVELPAEKKAKKSKVELQNERAMDITKLNGLQFSITGAAGEDGTYPEIRFYIDGNEAKDCIFNNTVLDNVDKLIAKIPEDDYERLVKVLIMKIQDAGEFGLAIYEMANSGEPQYVIISDMESYQEVCEFEIDIREFI